MLERKRPGAVGAAPRPKEGDLADQLSTTSPTHAAQAPDTALEETAARIKELLGVTDDDPATQRRVVIRNAARERATLCRMQP